MTYFYDDNLTYKNDPIVEGILSYSDEDISRRKLRKATKNLSLWRPYVKSFIVTKNNRVVWEKYLHSGGKDHCDNIHSVSKSVLSALAGIAISKQLFKLDDKVSDLLPECSSASDIRVKHLLSMTAGLSWLEDHTEYKIEKQSDWIKSILSRKVIFGPGEKFNYSSGLSHVLSGIITKTSGMSTYEFAHNHLFNKLKMKVPEWGKDPKGIYCGGFNFYMAPLDLVKFSLLYLNNGKFLNEQIIPKKWVEDSTNMNTEIDDIFYGYYWWIDFIRGRKVYMAWGFGGQFIYVIPSLNVTVVITSDTYSYSSEFSANYIIRRYIIPSDP